MQGKPTTTADVGLGSGTSVTPSFFVFKRGLLLKFDQRRLFSRA
jgi:hypothetical protein